MFHYGTLWNAFIQNTFAQKIAIQQESSLLNWSGYYRIFMVCNHRYAKYKRNIKLGTYGMNGEYIHIFAQSQSVE